MKKNNNITELVFILDKSGSMSGLESDTVGGFNTMIEKQKKQNAPCYVSTVLFNNTSEVLYDRVKLGEVQKMTEENFFVGAAGGSRYAGSVPVRRCARRRQSGAVGLGTHPG